MLEVVELAPRLVALYPLLIELEHQAHIRLHAVVFEADAAPDEPELQPRIHTRFRGLAAVQFLRPV